MTSEINIFKHLPIIVYKDLPFFMQYCCSYKFIIFPFALILMIQLPGSDLNWTDTWSAAVIIVVVEKWEDM